MLAKVAAKVAARRACQRSLPLAAPVASSLLSNASASRWFTDRRGPRAPASSDNNRGRDRATANGGDESTSGAQATADGGDGMVRLAKLMAQRGKIGDVFRARSSVFVSNG